MEMIEDLGLIEYGKHGAKTRCAKFKCPICNLVFQARVSNVKNGNTSKCRSCATSILNRTHRMSGTKLYYIWQGIKDRCNNSKNKRFKYYGGKGVKVFHLWENNFDNFQKWATSNEYKEGLSIDRIDNDGNYEPNNCRWVTLSENTIKANINKKNEAQLKAKDKITQDIKEAYELKSIAYDLLLEAIKLKDDEIERVKEAMQEFVNRCEKGEAIRSRYTYYKFKELLKDKK